VTLWGSLALPQSLASWPCESIATSELGGKVGKAAWKWAKVKWGRHWPKHPKVIQNPWIDFCTFGSSTSYPSLGRDCLHILRTAGPIHAPVLLWLQVNDRTPEFSLLEWLWLGSPFGSFDSIPTIYSRILPYIVTVLIVHHLLLKLRWFWWFKSQRSSGVIDLMFTNQGGFQQCGF